jgi:large subunit ribosomal protein L21e
MNRKGGLKRKSRQKLTRPKKDKGKISIRKHLQTFKVGDKVQLVADPSYIKGLFNLKFYGKIGTIQGEQGRSYKVHLKDQKKEKSLLVHPVHLKRV